MTNLEMFYFAGKCLSIDEHPEFREEIIKMISDDELDWAHFVRLCSNHLILPVIYLKFKKHKLIEHLPDELAEFLKEIYDLNLARNEKILLQINDILKLLNANDIYPTFLKGTGNLLDGLYSDKGERMIGDIDFLVPEKDYLKAAKILEDDGYEMTNPFYGNVLKEKHYPPIIKQGVPAYVEIHRLIVSCKHGTRFNQDTIEKNEIFGLEYSGNYVLCDRDKIIHNFIHSQLADQGNFKGLVSLKQIYDLYLMARSVDMASLIGTIPFRMKAISYFVFAGKALNLRDRFYPKVTFASKILIAKHSLNYQSPLYYKTVKGVTFLYDRLINAYLGQVIQAFYSSKMRHAVINRLINKQWYVNQFNSYKAFFRSI